jgi:hypothetical protein
MHDVSSEAIVAVERVTSSVLQSWRLEFNER